MTKATLAVALRKNRRLAQAAASLALSLCLTTCDMFKVGLGNKVDIDAPVVTFTSHSQNENVNKADFSLSGAVSDDTGISSLIVSWPGGSLAATVASGKWSADVGPVVADGRTVFTATVTDKTGKTGVANLSLNIDRKAPSVLVSSPQAFGASRPSQTSYIDIKGEVYDASSIAKVEVELLNDSGTVIKTKVADGTNSWSVRFLLGEGAADDLHLVDTKTYRYDVKATDLAGNVNTYYYHAQDIYAAIGDSDTFPAMSELGKVDQAGSGTVGSLASLTYAYLGAHRLGQAAAKYGDFTYDSAGDRPTIHATNLDPDNAVIANVLSSNAPVTGYVAPGPQGLPVNVASITATWKSYGSGDAPAAIPARWIKTTTISGSVSFSIDLRTADADGAAWLANGRYLLAVSARSSGQTSASSAALSVGFIIDSSAPKFEKVDPEVTEPSFIKRQALTFSSAPASREGVRVRVKLTDDNPGVYLSSAQAWTGVSPALIPASSLEYAAIPYNASDAESGDGWYGINVEVASDVTDVTLKIQGTDATSRTVEVNPHYKVDSELPQLVFALPADGGWLSGTATTLSGTASDNDLVTKVVYWAGKSGSFPGTAPSTWTVADGTSSWTATMNFSAGQGGYEIRVAAIDRASNVSAVSIHSVQNDDALPVLAESGIAGSANASASSASATKNADFSLSGTASDTNALAAVDAGAGIYPLTLKIDGVTTVPIAVAADGSWSYAYDAKVATHENDGVHVFVLTARDVAGKTTQVTRTVTLDTQAPTIEFKDPNPCLTTAGRPAVPTVNGDVILSGNASDNGTITKLEYKLGSASWADYTASMYGFSFSLDTTQPAFADKADYVLQARATDAAGNVTTVSKTMYVDQSSDLPTITLNGVDTAKTAAENLFLDDTKLQGWAEDDDGAVASVLVAVDGDIDSGTYASISAPPASPSTFFEHSLSGILPGQHRLRLRATDKNGKVKESDTLNFFIDRDKPAVAITSPASGGYRSAHFTMGGTASDANGLKTADFSGTTSPYVEVYTSGPDWEKVKVSSGTWSFEVPDSFISTGGDGPRTVKVRAYDTFNRESASPAELTFNVDRTPPTLSVSTNLADWQLSRNVSLSGTATDNDTGASGVAGVEYRINGAATWTALTGTTDWNGVATFPNGQSNSLEIRSVDKAGNYSVVASRTVKVDDADPTLTFAAPFDATTSKDTNGPVTFSGTIGDNLGLDADEPLLISLKQNGSSAGSEKPATGTGNWSYTFQVDASSHDQDGTWELTFTAKDLAGRKVTYTRNLTVETKPPEVAWNNVPPYEGLDANGDGDYVDTGDSLPAYNGNVTFKASISDDNRVVGVYHQWTTSATKPAYALNADLSISGGSWIIYAPANKNSWSKAEPTTGLSDKATNYLWILAVDKFGNVAEESYAAWVDQATDRPSLSFVNLTAGGAALDNNLGANSPYVLKGTVTDDDGVDKDKIYISTAVDANGNGALDGTETWSDFEKVSGLPSASGKSVSFSHGLAGLAKEKYYLVRIRVGDIYDASVLTDASPAAAMSWAESNVEKFVLDTKPPTLTIDQAKDQYRKGIFTLGGTASDEFGIKGGGYGAVSVDLNGDGDFLDDGETIALNSAGAWSASVDCSKFGDDGSKSFQVSTTDMTGRTTTAAFTFKLDTTPPARSVLAPVEALSTAAAYWHRGVLALSGEADDGTGSGVASVQVAVTAKGASPAAGDWKAATFVSNSWSYTYDCGAATEGDKTIHLVATDAVGNALPEATRDFGVDLQDPSLANLKIDNIAYSGLVYVSTKTIKLSGSAADSREIQKVVIEEKKPGNTAYTAVGTIAADAGAISKEWEYDRALGASDAEGSYLYRIIAYDTAGNPNTTSADATMSVLFDRSVPGAATVSSPAEDAYFGESALQIKGATPDDTISGLSRVEWSPDGSSWYVAAWSISGSVASWSATLDISASSGVPDFQAEGRKTVYVRAVDKAGNFQTNLASMASVHFWVDRASPTASFSAPSANAYVNGSGDLSVSIEATDANGIKEVRLRPGDSLFADTDPTTSSVSGNVYTGGIPRASILALSDGNHDIFARVKDNAGRMTVLSRPVVVDKTVPLVSFTSHAQGATVNKLISIAGTASDDRSLASVQLEIYNATTKSWTALPALSGSSNWSLASFNTEDYDTADYDTDAVDSGYQVKLRAIATDAAGNSSMRTGATRPSATSLEDAALAGTGTSLVKVGQYIAVGPYIRQVSSWDSASGVIGWSDAVDVTETSYSLSASILDLTIDQASDIPKIALSNIVTDATGSAASIDLDAAEGSAGDLIKLADHGLKAGDAVGFLATAFPDGLESGSTYYVIADGITADAFKVSATKGGTALDIKSPGSGLFVTYGGAYPTTLKMVNTIYGTVTDDDGAIRKLEASLDKSSWTEIPVSGGAWNWEVSTLDGPKNLYLRATDAIGASYSDELLILRRTAPVTSYVTGPIPFKIDRVPPEIGSVIYVDKTSTYDFVDQVELKSDTGVFGGPTNSFRLKISATDANGIKSVAVDITGKDHSTPTAKTITKPYSAARLSGDDFASEVIDLGASFIDGSATIQVTVVDNSGLSSSTTRSITVDNTAPTFSIYEPTVNKKVNGDVTVKGYSSDALSGLAAVRYKLGWNYASESWKIIDPALGLSTWQIAFSDSPLSNGGRIDLYASNGQAGHYAGESSDDNGDSIWEFPIIVQVEDKAGNTATSAINATTHTADYWLRVDPEGDKPEISEISYPSDPTKPVGGTVRVSGTAADDDAVYGVYMQIDVNGDGSFDAADVVSGDFDRNSLTPATTVDWYGGGNGKLINGTNNWYENINTIGEFNPVVIGASSILAGGTYTIVSVGATDFKGFGASSSEVGVTFTATRSGVAGDEGTVRRDRYKLRVHAQDTKNGTSGDIYGPWVETSLIFSSEVPTIGSSVPVHLVSSVAIPATASASSDLFQKAGHGLSAGSLVRFSGASLPGGIQADRPYYVLSAGLTNDAFKVSEESATGDPVNVTSDSSSFSYSKALMYSPGMYIPDVVASGVDWYLGGSLEDNNGISEIILSGDIDASLASKPAWFSGSGKSYSLAIPLTVNADEAKTLVFSVKVVNTTTPQRESMMSMRICIDSKAPEATFTGSLPVIQSDGLYKVRGTAIDVGSDIDRIEVYFVRLLSGSATSGRFYLPTHDGGANTITRDPSSGNATLNTRTFSDGSVAIYPATAQSAYILNVNHKDITESRATASFVENDDGDGFVEKLKKASGDTYEWYIDINALSIPDGPIELHYVVYDQSQNARHYKVSGMVQNSGPSVDAIRLGSDLDQSGAVDANAIERTSYASTASRTSTPFFMKGAPSEIYLDASSGNGALACELFLLQGSAVPASSIASGSKYVIESAGDTDFASVGAPATWSVGTVFTATGAGSGTGTARLVGYARALADFRDSGGSISAIGLDASALGAIGDSALTTATITSATADKLSFVASALGAGSVSAGDVAKFPSGETRVVASFDAATHTVAWAKALAAVPAGNVRIYAAKTFRIRVWDSAEELTKGVDTLNVIKDVSCVVLLDDAVPPVAAVKPFYWNGTGDNSMYDNDAANGHIEITGVSAYGSDPDVSGKISFRGNAFDDQRIEKIYFYLDGADGFEFPDAANQKAFADDGGRNYKLVSTYDASATTTNGFTTGGAFGTDHWHFEVTSSSFSQEGHKIEWRLDWDSAYVANVAALDRALRIVVEDKAGNSNIYATGSPPSYAGTASRPSKTSLQADALVYSPYGLAGLAVSVGSATTRVSSFDSATGTVVLADEVPTDQVSYSISLNARSYGFDVVPYVTGITTALSAAYKNKPSAYSRSALGKYPVREGEIVELAGFNFNGASTVVDAEGAIPASGVNPAGLLSGNVYRIATPGTTAWTSLGAADNAAGTVFTKNATAGSGDGTAYAVLSVAEVPGKTRTNVLATVGSHAYSGPLTARVNSILSINNLDANGNAWNKEGNGLNNPNLTDDCELLIWRFNSVESNITVKYPTMRISPTGQVGFSYGDIESDYVINVDGTKRVFEQSYSKYAHNTMAFDQATSPNVYGIAANTDRVSSSYGGASTMGFFSRTRTSGAWNYNDDTNKRRLESNWNGYQYNSVRSAYPDMVATSPASPTDASPTKIYMTYYDSVLGLTKFRYGTVGANADTIGGIVNGIDSYTAPSFGSAGGTNEGTIAAPIDVPHSTYRTGTLSGAGAFAYYRAAVEPNTEYRFTLDGLSANADLALYSDAAFTTQVGSSGNSGTTTDYVNYVTASGASYVYVRVQRQANCNYRFSYNDRGSATNYQVVAGTATNFKGGQYSAVGVTSGGTAVVAWYDKPNSRLVYSYNDNPGGNSEAQWQSHAVALDSDFSGWYVDLAVDGANGVHIAYYNASYGDLRYVFIPDPTKASLAYDAALKQGFIMKTVDAFLSTGTNIMIAVKQVGASYVPYISYYMGAMTATKYSLRMAYQVSATLGHGADPSAETYTGDWEIMAIPVNQYPKDYTVSVGFKDFLGTSKAPILGFATEADLETAQLK